MRFKFETADFNYLKDPNVKSWVADIANGKFEKWLYDAPFVYGDPDSGLWASAEEKLGVHTHRAKLVMIEEITQQSEERKLIREMLKRLEGGLPFDNDEWIEQAHKILERE